MTCSRSLGTTINLCLVAIQDVCYDHVMPRHVHQVHSVLQLTPSWEINAGHKTFYNTDIIQSNKCVCEHSDNKQLFFMYSILIPDPPYPLPPQHLLFSCYSNLFVWKDKNGVPWRDVIRVSARKELEDARYETDPSIISKLIITGRDAVQRSVEVFMAKRKKIIDSEAAQGHQQGPGPFQ